MESWRQVQSNMAASKVLTAPMLMGILFSAQLDIGTKTHRKGHLAPIAGGATAILLVVVQRLSRAGMRRLSAST
jgi:hypothetical protein